mmetsp:Transcript_113823/g.328722  ORF Transcript_113823/g.328722 Transcript_113823/m.328722 type:complete len:225 (+) Transcript_113823:893-1567(+)
MHCVLRPPELVQNGVHLLQDVLLVVGGGRCGELQQFPLVAHQDLLQAIPFVAQGGCHLPRLLARVLADAARELAKRLAVLAAQAAIQDLLHKLVFLVEGAPKLIDSAPQAAPPLKRGDDGGRLLRRQLRRWLQGSSKLSVLARRAILALALSRTLLPLPAHGGSRPADASSPAAAPVRRHVAISSARSMDARRPGGAHDERAAVASPRRCDAPRKESLQKARRG